MVTTDVAAWSSKKDAKVHSRDVAVINGHLLRARWIGRHVVHLLATTLWLVLPFLPGIGPDEGHGLLLEHQSLSLFCVLPLLVTPTAVDTLLPLHVASCVWLVAVPPLVLLVLFLWLLHPFVDDYLFSRMNHIMV
jgi:hypothetical protein